MENKNLTIVDLFIDILSKNKDTLIPQHFDLTLFIST